MQAIEADVFIGGQIAVADVAGIAAVGVRTIVNNRPDHEERGQPLSAQIEDAALAAGLAYLHVPIAGAIPADAVAAARSALTPQTGPVLMFCKSGMRSAALWALARAAESADPDRLIAAAVALGHDLRGYRPMLTRVSPSRL